jgi:hypothetical protein
MTIELVAVFSPSNRALLTYLLAHYKEQWAREEACSDLVRLLDIERYYRTDTCRTRLYRRKLPQKNVGPGLFDVGGPCIMLTRYEGGSTRTQSGSTLLGYKSDIRYWRSDKMSDSSTSVQPPGRRVILNGGSMICCNLEFWPTKEKLFPSSPHHRRHTRTHDWREKNSMELTNRIHVYKGPNGCMDASQDNIAL